MEKNVYKYKQLEILKQMADLHKVCINLNNVFLI